MQTTHIITKMNKNLSTGIVSCYSICIKPACNDALYFATCTDQKGYAYHSGIGSS